MASDTATRLSQDLDYILYHTRLLWEALRNRRIFITGGTGFFGCWLLESFVWVNRKLSLNAHAVVLTRNIKKFEKKCPHFFLEPSLVFQEGDVRNFDFPSGLFSYIIHAATDTNVTLNISQPAFMIETIVHGTQRVLEFARSCEIKAILLTSSGAVYGKQPTHFSCIPEEHLETDHQLEAVKSAYAIGKRRAEEICAQHVNAFNLNIKLARCFSFVGPYLPLDAHYAIGNFIRDGLKGEVITVKSAGTSYRSYLYAADLIIWLWTILLRGETMRAYNVGSNVSYTIGELAYLVANSFSHKVVVHFEQTVAHQLPERYVPDISRACDELGLSVRINLEQAIQKTVNWHTYFG